ncbi:MAG: beta-phosphoglucomutase [Firmicutes bacterium]|nr:beta-phosphoglucomutase [Bacillota bacterium]
MIRAIIFDLDGVICSTDDYHFEAWKALADSLGLSFDRKKNDRLRGVSRMASLEIVLEESQISYTPEEKQAMAEKENEIYKALLCNVRPSDCFPGVRETLQALKDREVKIAIGSSSKNTKNILTRLELIDAFDAIADGTDVTHSKPDPEVFLCAAGKLGISPSECAVVEDASAGIQAAKAAGMLAVAFGGDACTDPRADVVITKPQQLLDLANVCGDAIC